MEPVNAGPRLTEVYNAGHIVLYVSIFIFFGKMF